MTMRDVAVENRSYILYEYRRRVRSYRDMRQRGVDRIVLCNYWLLLAQSRRDALYWSAWVQSYNH